jgi:hypothetical protein
MPRRNAVGESEHSEFTRAVALPIGLLLGVFGAHRFYVGRTGSAVAMLCTMGGMGIWWLYDMILIFAGEFKDADGRRVQRWSSDLPFRAPRSLPASEAVQEEMDTLRSEMNELAERVDFMERILSKVRDRDAIPPGRG